MVKSSAHRGLIDLRLAQVLRARRPILIAHQGGIIGPNAPENSANAMRRAHARRYDMVELDVVAAKGDEPVLFHDGSSNGSGTVCVLGFADRLTATERTR